MEYFTQIIFIKEGQEKGFNEFEKIALSLLKEYNGKLIYRVRPTQETMIEASEPIPYEIHFLSFESDADFKSYGADPRRQAFLHLKESSIQSAQLIKGKAL